MKLLIPIIMLAAVSATTVDTVKPSISGGYLEVRSCDVYTGPCFANGEMNLTGKEGILVWNIREGSWKGAKLDGLSVIAVVRCPDTLGDTQFHPGNGKAVLVVDERADSRQREALCDLARTMGGRVIREVAAVKTSKIDAEIGVCAKAGCASVKAGDLIEISTRCLNDKDHLCGMEQTFYPPLTDVQDALPAFTEVASYQGGGLDLTWESAGQRSAFIASFAKSK